MQSAKVLVHRGPLDNGRKRAQQCRFCLCLFVIMAARSRRRRPDCGVSCGVLVLKQRQRLLRRMDGVRPGGSKQQATLKPTSRTGPPPGRFCSQVLALSNPTCHMRLNILRLACFALCMRLAAHTGTRQDCSPVECMHQCILLSAGPLGRHPVPGRLPGPEIRNRPPLPRLDASSSLPPRQVFSS
jgi:hypothetical protein